jgi:hypothetical protein
VKFFTPLTLKNDDTLIPRLFEIFRDIAAAFTDLVATGVAKINRIDDVPNEQYDLYTNTAAIKEHIHGTLASTVTLNNFIFSVRPTVTLSGTGTFRGYDYDINIAGSGASTAGYGMIGAITLHGAGTAKSGYNRAVAAAGCTGTIVGHVAGAQFADGSVANVWGRQTDITGPDNTTLPGLAAGSVYGSNTGGGGITHFIHLVNTQLTINNAVYRWNKANNTGNFFEALNADGVTFDYRVDSLGRLANGRGLTLVGNGYPLLVAATALTAQTAAISATTIFTATATGYYRVGYIAAITTAAGTSSSLGGTFSAPDGGFQVTYTDPADSVAKKTRGDAQKIDTRNTTATSVADVLTVYAKVGTAIQFEYGYDSTGSPAMAYNLRVTCEWLG